jgi:hypothetical protein
MVKLIVCVNEFKFPSMILSVLGQCYANKESYSHVIITKGQFLSSIICSFIEHVQYFVFMCLHSYRASIYMYIHIYGHIYSSYHLFMR